MKIATLFGEYPFEFQRVQRRRGELVVFGTVAGVESNVIFERRDLDVAARGLLVGLLLLIARRSRSARRRRSCGR